MLNRLSIYDKVPFVFTLGILPIITGMIFFRYVIFDQPNDNLLMQISFGVSFGAVLFTYVCKFKEDRKYSDIRKLEGQLRKLKRKKDSISILLDKTEKELNNTSSARKTELNESSLDPRKIFLKKTIDDLETKSDKIDDEMRRIRRRIEERKIIIQSDSISRLKQIIEKFLDPIRRDYGNDEQIKNMTDSLIGLDETGIFRKLDQLRKNISEARRKFDKELKKKLEKIMEKSLEEEEKTLKELGIDDEDDEDNKTNNQLLIFAALFAIIGGLAITASLEAFIDPDQNPNIPYAHNISGFVDLLISNPAITIASFFPVAINFIHCGIIFLSTDAVGILNKGNKFGVFISSLIIFLEGIALFYAGTSINNVLNFSFWFVVLVILDIAWVIINWLKAIDTEPQWLHLDLIMLCFLLSILFLFPAVSQVEKQVYFYVLVIFLSTTVVDYIIGWRTFWGVFDVSDTALG